MLLLVYFKNEYTYTYLGYDYWKFLMIDYLMKSNQQKGTWIFLIFMYKETEAQTVLKYVLVYGSDTWDKGFPTYTSIFFPLFLWLLNVFYRTWGFQGVPQMPRVLVGGGRMMGRGSHSLPSIRIFLLLSGLETERLPYLYIIHSWNHRVVLKEDLSAGRWILFCFKDTFQNWYIHQNVIRNHYSRITIL